MIPKISKDKTVLEVLKNYPEARTIFDSYSRQYDVCITCTALFSTLEELAVIRNIPLEKMLADLNEAVAGL